MGRPIASRLLEDAGSNYVSERKIYPRDVRGRFDRLRTLAVFWLLGMYYSFAWLRWDGRQAVLFDLPARKFHIFALTFWPQDFVFLALLLIILALALFFFTALAGRLWCGYACPQTVWTEVFLKIEHWIEGDRGARMKLDARPWNRDKLLRKSAKHIVWMLLALWTGFTFVGYFTPIADLGARLPSLQWNGWETFWVLFYGFATWGNAGFLREQVCKYMCPYARFQSAMFDRDTLIIAYDPLRGEPRGSRKRGLPSVLERARGLIDRALAYGFVFRAGRHVAAADAQAEANARSIAAMAAPTQGKGIAAMAAPTQGTSIAAMAAPTALMSDPLPRFLGEELGDCIDCTLCVQVCPTGIDIRNGLQYECIACGLCVDACDSVMDKMQYPHGLIRYSTQNAIDNQPSRVLRPRIFVYGLLLLAMTAGWAIGISTRDPLIAEVLRDRNALYRETSAGIANGYTLKLVNKRREARTLVVRLADNAAGIILAEGQLTLQLEPEQVMAAPVELVSRNAASGRQPVVFLIEDTDGTLRARIDSSFFGPVR